MRRSPLVLCFLLLALQAQADGPASGKIIERYKQMLAANPSEGTALDRLWKIYQDQGKGSDLIEEYRSGGTFDREMVLGLLLHKTAQNDNAIAAFQRAAKIDEKSPLPLLALARLEDSEGRGQNAAEWYEKAVALLSADDPRLPDTLLQLGAAWLSAGEPVKAAEAWERVAAVRPTDLDLRRKLADAYERNYLPARAITHLEYIVAHAPPADRAPALQRLALIHQGAGRQDAAIADLEKALVLTGPGNWLRPELESQLIRLHQRYHRTAELEERWKKEAQESPRDLGAALQLVGLYERLGDLDNEREWLTKLTQIAPKNVEYRLKLARLLTQMDSAESAAAIYDDLLKEQPTNSELVFERAKLDMLRNDSAPAGAGSRLGGPAAARARIAALLAARKDDETIPARALSFYEQNRLTDLVESQLTADAAHGSDEALTALANFYFSQHRDAEAKKTLERTVRPSDPAPKQAAARAQISQIFKGQNDLANAISEIKEAIRLAPDTRDYHLTLGDLYSAHGSYPEALAEFTTLGKLSATPRERIQADQKLFECFHSQGAAAAAASGKPAAPTPFPTPGTDGLPEPNPALDEYLGKMQETAEHNASEASWLRLGRWLIWNHDLKGALAAINSALEINPKSVPAYELMVDLNAANGPSPRAVDDLQKLAELDPVNRTNYQRRAGQLELQSGRILEALDIFQKLAAANPGNIDALSDLALTQQRADRWNEALTTWQKIYAVSPASRKKEAMGPLLHAYEKVELHSQAAGLLLTAIDAAGNDHERFSLFGDMLAYCTKHNLLEWQRIQFEKRRQLHPDDYFTEVALGRILKASGQYAAAFELFADASYAAPNQADALPDLVHEAEDLHKLDAAVKLQAQLIRIAPQDSPDALEKLAQLQEKDFKLDDAAATWDRVVAKFPRDSAALNHAIQFQLDWGDESRAVVLLRAARALEPANLRTLATLAELDSDAGNAAEAEFCLDEILRATPAEKAGDPLRFPAMKLTDAGRLQTAYLATVEQRNGKPSTEAMRELRSFWVDDGADAKSDRDFRLNAIRQRAQLLQAKPASPARAAWIARWKKETAKPSEALWALFYAGDGDATLDRLEAMISGNARNPQASQAYVWLALQTRQFARLRTWLQDRHRTPTERDYVFIALGQLLDANGGQFDPGLIDTLFADGTHLRLWQAAMLFASHNHFREAAQLGQRVFDQASSQRPAYGEELARWHLLLGAPDKALAVLKASIQYPVESFEAPACAALRDYYLLLPEKDRAAFVKTYLAGIEAANQPLHAVIASTLLHGLAGDERSARADLSRLLDMRVLASLELDEPGAASVRHWRFLLNTGIQLQAWKLDRLAADLWQKAVADEALVQLEGEQIVNAARDIRQRLCAIHAASAPIGELHRWMDEYARIVPHDGPAPLAAALATMGANVRAIQIYREIWDHDHNDPEILRNLLSACRAAGDDDSAEAVLSASLNDPTLPLNDGARREFVIQYADLLERGDQLDRAVAVLADSLQSAPGDIRILQRLGQLTEKAGRSDQAIAVYRQMLAFEPGNVQVRLALSSILEHQGRLADAIELAEKVSSPELDARLAWLRFKNHQTEEALTALERIPPPQHVAPVLQVAEAMAAEKDFTHARIAVQAALNRSTDARMKFPLECKLIELLTPEDGPSTAQRELRRLRKLAAASPTLLGSYLEFASSQATRLNLQKEFTQEVTALWADGKGPIPAALCLLDSACGAGNKTAAAAVTQRLLAREDAPEALLQLAANSLEKAQFLEPLAVVQERLTRMDPMNEQHALNLARTYRQLGRADAATAILDSLAQRAAITDDLAAKVAAGYAEAGDLKRASVYYRQALRNDPFAKNFGAMIEYAQTQSRLSNPEGAWETLRAAFANPANRNFDALIDWIVTAGRFDQFDSTLSEFELTPARLSEARRAAFGYFEKASQVSNAVALLQAHPEILRSGMLERLRGMASRSHDFSPAAVLMEKLRAQDTPEASITLAGLYSDWAQFETGKEPDAALAHLKKARDLHPEMADFALRLSKLQSDRGDRRGAIETLQSFLAVAKNPADAEKARAQLAKLTSGG